MTIHMPKHEYDGLTIAPVHVTKLDPINSYAVRRWCRLPVLMSPSTVTNDIALVEGEFSR
jgi:hypothetical protein